MDFYNVLVTTDMGEELLIQVPANTQAEAELAAIEMVEDGYIDCVGRTVIDCFADMHS